MTLSMKYLAWTLVLAIVQVLTAAYFKRRQDGLQWAAGNRDTPPRDYTGTAARMVRAQANLYESLPLMIGAVLLAHLSGHDGRLAGWGAALYFWGRVLYIPIYAMGLVPWRTLVWAVSVTGLVLTLASLA